MKIKTAEIKMLVLATSVAILTACGGGGGGSKGGGTPTPTDPVQPVATAKLDRNHGGCTVEQPVGGFTNATLDIKDAVWMQVVGQRATATDTLLAGDKETRLRVDVTASGAAALPVGAKLVVAVTNGAATVCEEYTLTAAAATVPASVDYRTLGKSYVATLPDGLPEGTHSYQIVVHAADNSAAAKLWQTGTVKVAKAFTDKVVVYPVTFNGQTATVPSVAELKALVLRTMPHADVTVEKGENITLASLTTASGVAADGGKYRFTYAQMESALSNDIGCLQRHYDVTDPDSIPSAYARTKCIAVYPSNMVFEGADGMATLSGTNILTPSFDATDVSGVTGPYSSHWLTRGARVFAHEYGHVLGLGHAKCGTTEYLDNKDGVYRLYENGRLGSLAMGYDAGNDFYFADTAGTEFADLMSYCGKEWMSDKGYRAVIGYMAR